MESSIQKVSKKEKTFISLRAHGLSVYCFRLYKDLVKMMSMYVRDEKRQDIFYSLMTGTDTVSYTHLDVYKRQVNEQSANE